MAFGQKQHFHIATDGVRSCNPCIIATMGLLGFDVKITVEREKYSGYRPEQIQWEDVKGELGDNYIIKITVTYKNRKWTIERLISQPLFDRLSVTAEFLRFEKLRTIVSASFSKILNTIKIFAKRI